MPKIPTRNKKATQEKVTFINYNLIVLIGDSNAI